MKGDLKKNTFIKGNLQKRILDMDNLSEKGNYKFKFSNPKTKSNDKKIKNQKQEIKIMSKKLKYNPKKKSMNLMKSYVKKEMLKLI